MAESSPGTLPTRNAGRLLAILIAGLVWSAIAAQLWLSISTALPGERGTAVLHFFSFFTVWTNLLVGLTVTFRRRFSATGWRSALASYIALVALIYVVLLSHLQSLDGLRNITDLVFHKVVPVLYIAWWFFYGQSRRLRWGEVVAWLSFPAIYLAYCLCFGRRMHWYPYPFVNVALLGYAGVAVRACGVATVALVLGLLTILLNRRRMTLSRILEGNREGHREGDRLAARK